MTEAKPILGYWNIRAGYRGNANRYLLAHAGVDYEDKQYDCNDMSGWGADKASGLGMDFPNLPYIIDGDFRLSESKAVSVYICDRWCPALLGKNAEERAHIIMLQCIIEEAFMACVKLGFGSPDRAAAVAAGMEKMGPICDWLGSKKFLVGTNVSMVDYYMFEIIETFNAIDGDNGVYKAHP